MVYQFILHERGRMPAYYARAYKDTVKSKVSEHLRVSVQYHGMYTAIMCEKATNEQP